MRKYIFFIVSLLFVITKAQADNVAGETKGTDSNIFGHVVDAKTGEHIPWVVISLKGTTIGTTTDATGHYTLKDLPEGKFMVEARYVGYETQTHEVVLKKKKTLELDFEITPSSLSLDEVVVSANRNETNRKLAPTLVSILDITTFDRTNSATISDGLNFQPGLRVENNCQNCGFTQVRMNGLAGAYSQILIDSRPVFSSLAGVYGLEQIPATMIDRVEVVRGGGSALFGASAIAGTINIITKEPLRNSAQLSHNITSIGGGGDTFENNTNFNVSIVSDNQKMGVMAFGQKRNRSAYDHDGDGFSEMPHLDNRTLGFRSFLRTGTYSKITLEYHNMHEFRRGGDRINEQPFNAYIAEQIESKIDGGSVKFDLFSPDSRQRFSVYTAAQLTDRDSYYGGGTPLEDLINANAPKEDILHRLNSFGNTKDITLTMGAQYSYEFNRLLFMPSSLTGGAEYTYNKLEDESGYRPTPIDQEISVVGAYVQNEWKNDMWGFLIGGRLDKHKLLSNPIFSPRANIRYNPTKDVNIRLSYGQGFRAPQLFDEDLHVAISGGEVITQERDPNLKEEKSHSLSGSVDYYVYLPGVQLNFLAEGFFTKLNNPFTTISQEREDGTTVKTIVNASGAKVYGMTFEARAAVKTLLQVQLGATVQRSRYDVAQKWTEEDGANVEATKRMMRTPDVYGYLVTTLTPTKRLSVSLSGTYTGKMLVPHERELRTHESSTFVDTNCKVAYNIPIYKSLNLEVNAGVQNMFNAYQNDFDKGADRASTYIYGPSSPRSYFAGLKMNL